MDLRASPLPQDIISRGSLFSCTNRIKYIYLRGRLCVYFAVPSIRIRFYIKMGVILNNVSLRLQ